MGFLSRAPVFIFMLGTLGFLANAAESDALAISANIQARHLPFGTILDPIYASPTSDQIVGYTRCGDSALWTGAYLAAESFRYNVTQSADALKNVKTALAGLKALADVTGDNRLARCMVLAASPYAAGIASEESANTIHQAPPWIWVDNTSRDQVVGAFFGLAAAYDLVNDDSVKSGVSSLATRLLGFIADHQWSPNDDISNTFRIRPEEIQMLVQVARHVNPANGISGPFLVAPLDAGVLVDVQSNSSYFKFNLDYMSLYNLVLLQDNSDNRGAYKIVRDYTASHQNAFFDIVDRALNGANAGRDAEAATLLDQFLQRPKRDAYVDLTKSIQACGTEACQPVPVPLRPPADFLWQTDPFALTGGGSGIIESAGIDYILPYWMGRYYGVIGDPTVQSAAAASSAVAPSSLAAMYGTDLALGTAQAGSQPLPLSLAQATIIVMDSAGAPRIAPLIYASPNQINFGVPAGTAAGMASFLVSNGSTTQAAMKLIQAVAPGLFSMNGTGKGVAAALAFASQNVNPALQSPVPVFHCDNSGCVSVPIGLSADSTTYVSLYGTGIRNVSSLGHVSVTVNGASVPVLYAGAAPGFTDLDQVNISLTPSLAGSGEANVILTADGQASNTVTINIR
jgi:uncharacterized protein (TIGR03437 family)